MAVIPAVVTDDARKYWPQFFGGLLGLSTVSVPGQWNPLIKSFKVGEGGWVDPGDGILVPRTPDATLRRLQGPMFDGAYLQDIDAVVDADRAALAAPTRYSSTSRAVFEKTLTLADFSFVGPSKLQIQCLLDFTDFNDDGSGNSPEIWELGVFSDHPDGVAGHELMVAYATFPKEIKDATKQVENIVRIVF